MGKKKPKEKKKAAKGVWKAYDAKDGKLTRKNKYCPKCGEGYFLAKHKDRESCGKCGYAEFGKKSE